MLSAYARSAPVLGLNNVCKSCEPCLGAGCRTAGTDKSRIGKNYPDICDSLVRSLPATCWLNFATCLLLRSGWMMVHEAYASE